MDSLLRLFNSDVFTLQHLLYYLHNKKQAGIQEFLINKLYSYPLQEVLQYFPQLFNIMITKQSPFLQRYFLQQCISSHALSLQMFWMIGSCQDFVSQQKSIRLSHDTQMVIVNGCIMKIISTEPYPQHFFSLDIEEDELQKYSRKKVRSEYFNYQHRFIQTLCKISVGLVTVQQQNRDQQLKAWLRGLQSWIRRTRNENSQQGYQKRLFRGVFFPINYQLDPETAPTHVVRIIWQEAMCFSTKARVPYKILLQTVQICEEVELERSESILHQQADVTEVMDINIDQIGNTHKKEQRYSGLQQFAQSAGENKQRQQEKQEVQPCPVWGESWESVQQRIRSNSPFGSYRSWKLRGLIVKGLDDLRQEQLAMQFIRKMRQIFIQARLPLFLQPYDILIVGSNIGIIEYIPNTQSLHGIKKNSKRTLLRFFEQNWKTDFDQAQKNFIESMAGYSLLCYILNVKDRHNGNILLDNQGHIIHIDYGFFLTTSPGRNMGFQIAPFKLLSEHVEVMGGVESQMYRYFIVLLFRGFVELRKYFDQLVLLFEMMHPGSHLPCLMEFDKAISKFKERFHFSKTEQRCMELIESLVQNSLDNWRTTQYDYFQYISNEIYY